MKRQQTSDALIVAGSVRLKLELRRSFLASRPQEDSPEAETRWLEAHSAERTSHPQPDESGPRAALVRTFGLTDAETALLDLCVAVAVDPFLETLVASAQGNPSRPVPTEALTRRLFGLAPGAIWRPTSPIARWILVEPVPEPSGAAPGYRADPRIVDWYFGRAALDEGLVGICTLPGEDDCPPVWDTAEEVQVISGLCGTGRKVRVTVLGDSGTGRCAYASALVSGLDRRAIFVRGDALPQTGIEDLYRRIQRFAALTGRVPIWTSEPPVWPSHVESATLQLAVTEGRQPAAGHDCVDHVIAMPSTTPEQRRQLWSRLAGPSVPLPLALGNASVREIWSVAPLARTRADLAARMLGQRALSELSSIGRVLRPDVGWDDMVLAADVVEALRDYADEARLQGELMGKPEIHRLYRKDAAPTALFSGPPGVGKTMAAECIAADLELPLLVIDVARTVSKYIGETAKNLSRVFSEARRFGCILFFDEADAYFSKRTDLKDSQDRHANADTNHLLQLIEDYEGFVILSTNRRANIDEAFFRRIRHAVEFHRPNLPERMRLWRQFAELFLPPAALAPLTPALETCAARFEISPAQIKAAMLSAHYAARKSNASVSQRHLMSGIARELRKEGRNLPADLATLTRPDETGETVYVA